MTSKRIPKTKKIINSLEKCVDESLSGLVAANDRLRYFPDPRIVIRSDYKELKEKAMVTLLSGGGSGHEPFAAGFVGKGMLTAAVAGNVFTSPPSKNILTALRLLGNESNAGTVLIVANYTGDRINFGLAIEQAKAEGYRVEMIVVHDDCALLSGDKSAGRRGLCGIVLAFKVAGAMAESGRTLEEITRTLTRMISNLGSIGLSLTSCSIPGSGPNFMLEEDEVELGMGVHGEAGVNRMKLKPATEMVAIMLTHMVNPKASQCISLKEGDRVVLLVNNLGGSSNLEINIVTWEAINWLESHGMVILRVFVAPVMTSLEMAGVTINILKADDVLISCIDAKTEAPCWPRSYQTTVNRDEKLKRSADIFLNPTDVQSVFSESDLKIGLRLDEATSGILKETIRKACAVLIEARDILNELDRSCGDGDTGTTLSSGAQAILDALGSNSLAMDYPFCTLQQLSNICQQAMGGASGGLYAVFFMAASVPLKTEFSIRSWLRSLELGAEAITKYGGAARGDRSLLDALLKAVDSLHYGGGIDVSSQARIEVIDPSKKFKLSDIMNNVAKAAEEGANETARMGARVGRASYVSADRCLNNDPGAQAVAILFRSVANTLTSANL